MARIFASALAFVLVVLVARSEAGPLNAHQATRVNDVTPRDVGSATGPAAPVPASSQIGDTKSGSVPADTNTVPSPGTSSTGTGQVASGGATSCNDVLLKLIGSVASASENAKLIKPAAQDSDQSLIKAANSLESTADGMKTVAETVAKGQAVPADASQKVSQGLREAQVALQSLGSSDSSVSTVVKDLDTGIAAVQDLAKCTPSAPAIKGTGTGTNNGTSSSTNSGTSSGTNSGTISGTNSGAISGTNTGTSSGTNTGTSSGTNTGTSSGTNTGTSSGTNTGTSSGTNTGTSSGTNGGTDSGTSSSTGSGTNSGTISGTNSGDTTSGTDSGTGSGTVSGTNSGVLP